MRYVMPEDIVRNRDVGTGYAEGLGPAGERASPRPHPPGGGGRGYRRPLPWASAGPGGDGPARGGGAGHRRPRRSSLPWRPWRPCIWRPPRRGHFVPPASGGLGCPWEGNCSISGSFSCQLLLRLQALVAEHRRMSSCLSSAGRKGDPPWRPSRQSPPAESGPLWVRVYLYRSGQQVWARLWTGGASPPGGAWAWFWRGPGGEPGRGHPARRRGGPAGPGLGPG